MRELLSVQSLVKNFPRLCDSQINATFCGALCNDPAYLVRGLPSGVEDEYACVGLVVVGRVHRLEALLTSSVPKI